MNLTLHVKQRIRERNLSENELAAAMAGRVIVMPSGDRLYYDRRSRCAIVVNPFKKLVVTAYRLTKRQVKLFSSYERME